MTLYDRDFHAWGHEQAAALRRRSANEIDWDNIAEEIEGLSKTTAGDLKNRYMVALTHLLKWSFQPERRSRSWVLSVDEQRLRIQEHLEENPSLAQLEPDLFAKAYRSARLRAARETKLPRSAFPEAAPFSLEQAKDEAFWPGEQPPADWR